MADDHLTAGQVAERLGIKTGMVRRYALSLENVTGVSIETDPVRGRLYPPAVVELLEATRAHLLANPGSSVEQAMRAVTGNGEGSVTPPARVPGTLTPADLERALEAVLSPLFSELETQRRENEALRNQVGELVQEVQGMRSQLARLEVTTHAALPVHVQGEQQPEGWNSVVAGLARLFKR